MFGVPASGTLKKVRLLPAFFLFLSLFDPVAPAVFADPPSDGDPGPTKCTLLGETAAEYLRTRSLRFGDVPVENIQLQSDFLAEAAEATGNALAFGDVNGVSKILGMITYRVSIGEPRILTMDVLNVAPALRGQGFGAALVAEAYEKSSGRFRIAAMTGALNGDSSAAFAAAIDAGKNEADAWRSTPIYKMWKRLGYAKLRLDLCDPVTHRIWVERGE